MNRSHSPTPPQLARIGEYKAQGYVIDPTKSSESVEMTKGARRIAICWNGLVKALGGRA